MERCHAGPTKGLVGDVKFKGSPGCGDHEIVEFKFFKAATREAHYTGFQESRLCLFRDLLERVWSKKASQYTRFTFS